MIKQHNSRLLTTNFWYSVKNTFAHFGNSTKSLILKAHKFLNHLQFFKMGEIMVLKYGLIPRGFPEKVTSDIDFTDEEVVQCDTPDSKILL